MRKILNNTKVFFKIVVFIIITLITNTIILRSMIKTVKDGFLVPIIIGIIGVIAIVVISVFICRQKKRLFIRKLNIDLLISTFISFFIAGVTMVILSEIRNTYISYLRISTKYTADEYIFLFNATVFFIIVLVLLTYTISFWYLTKEKIKYINFLISEIRKIEAKGFGNTIKVEGNDELAELCRSINSMSIELKSKLDNERNIENTKNELITNISHDLRTPLTSIIGYIDLIKKNEYRSDVEFREYVDIIYSKANNVNKLINELFDYTKLNNKEMKLELNDINIISLIEQMIGEYIYIFNKEGLTLESSILDEEVFVKVDIEKMVRVLENLFSNAKKYSKRGSKVSVEVKTNLNNLQISISNETEDLDEENIKKIFNRFYKFDKSRGKEKSSGLGLAIVKRIIELHNGSIEAKLNGNIITFILEIPLLCT